MICVYECVQKFCVCNNFFGMGGVYVFNFLCMYACKNVVCMYVGNNFVCICGVYVR